MRFGKISYLNLLPFDVFIKKYPVNAAFRLFLNARKSYPSKLNHNFLMRRIDGGFISSIAAESARLCLKHTKASNAGIIARGAVWSVIVLPNPPKQDYQSASSNALSQILGLKGEVLIGDRALKAKLAGQKHIDIGEKWWEKQHLGFCFGRMCFSKHKNFYEKMINAFIKTRVKIPHYILYERARQSGIAPQQILSYLTHIHYRITKKEQIALNRFYAALRVKRIKKPARF